MYISKTDFKYRLNHEFEKTQHLKAHFSSVDDGMHVQVKWFS